LDILTVSPGTTTSSFLSTGEFSRFIPG